MNKGIRLYKLAKKIILGGNMLLSKRPEMLLPDKWPAYFSRAKDTFLWDLDNNKYLDMMCLVGHNVLGYSNKIIDNEVSKYIKKGNMSSLNCPEEVYLTKKLLDIHKWAGMVKFARSGGEANSIAIRIARSVNKKSNIAICGYHGWHDWYLSVNLKNHENLNDHLLPGLNPIGVSKNLINTVFTFKYGNFQKLKKLINDKKIGIIIMEIARYDNPNIDFIKKIRNICNQKNIVLIFDECTTGFRNNLGGLHLKTKINPDIAMFGKAIANGYALTAIIGKKEIMKRAENSFISSTFWGERSGFIAALKTIEIMREIKSWKTILSNGKYIQNEWKRIAKKNNLKIKIRGIDTIISFELIGLDNQIYKSFITQEMLNKKILASNLIYVNIFHKKKLIDKYIKNLDIIFKKIKYYEENKIKDFLKVKKAHKTFERINE
tara:strand:- start:313 stop:1614 length:1302 start_codon:yes stop_codon:yes gene_type:complete